MEIDMIKGNQVEILELKGKITEINHSLQGLNSRSEQAEARISKLEGKFIAITAEEQKGKK